MNITNEQWRATLEAHMEKYKEHIENECTWYYGELDECFCPIDE